MADIPETAERDEPADGTAEDDVEDSTSSELDDLLEDARKFMTLCKELNAENNKFALDDLKFLSGGVNQWDKDDAAQRSLDGRPMITVNKLPTFLHQVTNNLRQNKSSIKVHPASGGANIDTAKVRQGVIRNIEYDSSADVAYATAACSAAGIGFGYWRLITDYCSPKSMSQEIRYKRIRNPFIVNFDPLSEMMDGSDAKRVLIESRMTRAEFKRQWPDADANDTALALGDTDLATNWMFTDEVVVAEYYRVEEVAAVAVLLQDGTEAFEEDLTPEQKPLILKKRDSFKRKVMLYKITGCDKLEETEVMCYWIPVFPVYGDELDIDGKVLRSGLIRHSKDSLKMYNYWMTCATEEVALRPKTPYIGAAGQFEGFETDWAQANRKSFPYIQYNPVTIEGNLAPAPQRQPMVDIPSGMLQMAMHANDNIKATTGLFDSSLGARGNATSGKQELAQQRQGDISNFHFLDSLQTAIKHCARCINWMIPHYYDTMRVVKIMGDDETVSSTTINQPNPQIGAIEAVLNDMTGGEYTVTVEAGPPYQTLRQEAAELFSDMAHNNQQLMQVAGDLIIGEMDIPGADKIAARIKKSIPPQLTDGENEEDKNNVDAKLQQIGQIKQQIDQQQQQMQEHGQMLQEQEAKAKEETMRAREAQTQVDTDKMALDAERQVMKAEFARMQAELKLAQSIQQNSVEEATDPEQSIEWRKALLDADTKIAVAEISANTTKTTAAMSANAKGDGTTSIGLDGSTQPSSGLATLIDSVNANMAAIVNGQQLLTDHITRPKVRSAKKQPDGSFLMTEQ